MIIKKANESIEKLCVKDLEIGDVFQYEFHAPDQWHMIIRNYKSPKDLQIVRLWSGKYFPPTSSDFEATVIKVNELIGKEL